MTGAACAILDDGSHDGTEIRCAATKDRILTTLDPRAPLVLDTRELGRRPGVMREVRRVVPAPVDLGIAVIGVPEGADLELDLRLEAVVEGVLVSGTARAALAGECARCLEPLGVREIEVELQELFVHDDVHGGQNVEEDERSLQRDLLDLEPTVRDAVVLALPLAPVCREDCPGLCSECGVLLAADPGHAHETTDPRWERLRELAHQPHRTEET